MNKRIKLSKKVRDYFSFSLKHMSTECGNFLDIAEKWPACNEKKIVAEEVAVMCDSIDKMCTMLIDCLNEDIHEKKAKLEIENLTQPKRSKYDPSSN